VSIIFLKRQVLFQHVIHVIVLQNAAKYGKLVENFGNFVGARFGPLRGVLPRGRPKRIFIDCEECCKYTLMAGRRTASPGFPADGPDRISYYPLGGISCI
jgi:hypothetical protein